MVASDVTSHAAKVYLNDASQVVFTNSILLPFLAEASLELEQELRANEIAFQKRASIDIEVDIGDVELPQYPTDFIEPIALFQKTRDAADTEYREVEKVEWEPITPSAEKIIAWAFRNGKIYFPAPTTNLDVRLHYVGGLTAILTTGSTVDIEHSKSYLAARLAQLAFKHLVNNPNKADGMSYDVEIVKDMLIRSMLKVNQDVSRVRRIAYNRRGR